MKTVTTIVKVDKKRELVDAAYAASFRKTVSFCSYDDKFLDLVGSDGAITAIETRDYQFAHEAGVYNKATNAIYFTSNYQTTNPIQLYKVDCDTYEITQLNYPDVVMANGACQYKDGVLYCVQGDLTRPSSLVLVDPVTEKSETLINNFHGLQFSSINDVVVHHETGEIWFTDPTYGWMQAFRPFPVLPAQVYRLTPATGEITCVADGYDMCNGLCFSPDYKTLYVTDTGAIKAHAGPGDGHQFSHNSRGPSAIYAYDVIDKRYLGPRRFFTFCDTGIPDGIKCDDLGNVYSGCGDGVHVWDPSGALIGKIIVGQMAANFCFAKGGIWIFGERTLYFAKFKAKGALVAIECE